MRVTNTRCAWLRVANGSSIDLPGRIALEHVPNAVHSSDVHLVYIYLECKQSWYTERTRKSISGREKSNEKTLFCTNEDTQSQMDAEELEEKEIGYNSLLLLIISREWSLLLARGIWITVGMTLLVASVSTISTWL